MASTCVYCSKCAPKKASPYTLTWVRALAMKIGLRKTWCSIGSPRCKVHHPTVRCIRCVWGMSCLHGTSQAMCIAHHDIVCLKCDLGCTKSYGVGSKLVPFSSRFELIAISFRLWGLIMIKMPFILPHCCGCSFFARIEVFIVHFSFYFMAYHVFIVNIHVAFALANCTGNAGASKKGQGVALRTNHQCNRSEGTLQI